MSPIVVTENKIFYPALAIRLNVYSTVYPFIKKIVIFSGNATGPTDVT
jgi:hypothetical protein